CAMDESGDTASRASFSLAVKGSRDNGWILWKDSKARSIRGIAGPTCPQPRPTLMSTTAPVESELDSAAKRGAAKLNKSGARNSCIFMFVSFNKLPKQLSGRGKRNVKEM